MLKNITIIVDFYFLANIISVDSEKKLVVNMKTYPIYLIK